MDVVEETVRYTYRLRPGRTALSALANEWHRCRWLWNECVRLQRDGHRPTMKMLGAELTAARSRAPWLREGSQVAQQQMLRSYDQALRHSFQVKGRGRPTMKSRRRTPPSLEYTKRGFSIRDGRLVLPKGVSIPVVWSRELPSEPTSVRVYRDSLGHWYASFVVRREREELPEVEGGIGIDWGVSATATTTSPEHDLPHLGHRHRSAAELAKAQRQMSRRRRPRGHQQSKGYKRAKLGAAKATRKSERRNTHEGRAWARKVVADHQTIAVEDFKPKFLAKSTMARKAADNAIGTVKRTLVEYAERAGRTVVMVEPAYTTMTCSSCFARNKRLGLGERTFLCPNCGYTDSRDRNAARVILAVAERGHTSVESVRHSMPPSGVSGAA